MIRSFMDGLRRGRDEIKAEHWQRSSFAAPVHEQPAEPPVADADEPDADTGQHQAHFDELESTLRTRDAECAEYKQLLGELADNVEQQQTRIAELEAAIEPFSTVLRLPGVEVWLRMRFHPDKSPDADADQLHALTEATKQINAVYATIRQNAAREKDQPDQPSETSSS
jgi:hypothetical protein